MSTSNKIVEFFQDLAKASADDASGLLSEKLFFWRSNQALKLKEKLEGLIEVRGIKDRKTIPLKLIAATIDAATIEEDDELHTKWAKMLANALDPKFKPEVRILYTDILRSLNAFDIRLLDEIYRAASETDRDITEVAVKLPELAKSIGVTKQTVLLSADCLIRQRCIIQAPKMYQPGQVISHGQEGVRWVTPPAQQVGLHEHIVKLTQLGVSFVKCCS